LASLFLFSACTTKIGSINPNQPNNPKMQSVYGVACKAFTWPYGNKDDDELKQQAMQQVNTQAQAYVTAANAKEAELANVNITKNIWPWFWGLMGQKCVEARGYAIPKGLSAQAQAQADAEKANKENNTTSCEGWKYVPDLESVITDSLDGEGGAPMVSPANAKNALEAFTRDSKSSDLHTKACALEGLGTLYYTGVGVKKNKRKAIELFEQEGKLGYGNGYRVLADMFRTKDIKKSEHYLELCKTTSHKPPHQPGEDGDSCQLTDLRG
ncbi:SEL1-like repeat protein, partial [Helicobacter felis]|uniref:sel1 repeat family protein n=1 Tax=Helicobacter felis TaxID=214 RepID=UPI000CF0265B